MANLKWGSSLTDPSYANYKGSQTYNFQGMASSGGQTVNAQGLPQISGGQTLGASTTNATINGGGDNRRTQLEKIGASRNPGQESKYQSYLQQAPNQSSIDYDALIQPALQALDEAMVPAQSEYGANVAGIEAARSKGKGQLQSTLTEAETSAKSQKGEQTKRTESAIDEARRQFAEMQQGLQARYGKTTGTGAFAETYLGGQALKGISQQRAALTSAVQQIDDRLEQVKGITQVAMQDIDQQAEAQKLQAKSSLDNALSQIRTAKGQLLSQKAQLAQQAMQFYQQQVQQVNANNAAFKQQLLRDQTAAEQRLAEARQSAGNQIQKLQSITVGNADTGYFGTSFNPATGEYGSPTQLTGAGQMSTTPEDDLTKRLRELQG